MDLMTGLLVGGGSLVSGLLGSSSAKKAAKAQAAAAAEANALQREMWQTGRQDAAPWREAGTDAISYLRALLLGENDSRVGSAMTTPAMRSAQDELAAAQAAYDAALNAPAPQQGYRAPVGQSGEDHPPQRPRNVPGGGNQSAIDSALARLNAARAKLDAARAAAPKRQAMQADEALIKSPGYQFRLGEGEKGIQRAAGAAGSRYSGSTLKALQRFGQDFASNEFGNHVNRIMGLSGAGQTAVGQSNAVGMNYGNQAAGNIVGAGQATAQGYLNSGSAINNAVQGGIQNYLVSNYLSQNPLSPGP